jgi:two-component system, NarL family, capsular synthesis sensor histidine kinase RcsC
MESDQAVTMPHQTSIQSTMLAGRGRVLLVEDNPVNRELIQQQLEELGFEVDVAEDGKDGLRKWAPSTYVAVLTDINMPHMSGYELARTLRERDDRLPIVAITATALASEKAQCREAGITEVLLKPLSLESLNEALGHYLTRDDVSPSQRTNRQVFSAKILRTFVERGSSDLAALRKAMEERDTQTLVDVIHSFKGALLMLGESTAAGECSMMESTLQEQGATVPDDELQHFIEMVQGVVQRYEVGLADRSGI